MAELGGDRTHLVEDEGGRGIPMRSTKSDQPKMSLQQAVRDGREEIVKTWLTSLIGRKKKHILDAKDSYGFTAMHYAARFNRFKIMQLLLSNDADPEILTDEGLTPLHYAARYTPLSHGSTNDDESAPVTLHSTSRQIMQFLITLCRVNINVQDIYGLTPLHLACSRGNRAAVEALVNAHNININIQDKKQETPLHAACLFGDPYIVEQLLRKDADCLLKNIENVTPLHIACQEGYIEIVNLIMRLRFNQRRELLNAYDLEFNFPLHLACESGEVEIVKVLFLNQADPNVIKIHDITPLHIAAKEGFTNVAEVLLQYEGLAVDVTDENLLTPLHYAARHNNITMIKFLLKKGADIEAQDVDSYTPLLVAVAHGQLQAMDVLIESGASIDDVDRNGKSVIFIAAEKNQTEVLKSLILGAHEAIGNSLVSTVDATNNTPLHIACEKGNLEAIKILLRSEEIKLDARNEFDRTPMHMAANEGHTNVILELARYCRQKKLDVVKDEDDDANTPLHLACINGHFNAAKALLGAGADPDARNVRQWTPMDCAADKGREKIIQLLIDAGADIDPKDIASVTPLQLACQQGHLKVAKLLMENGAKASLCNSSKLNALDIAVENGNKDVAMMIIKSPQWQSALRNVTHYPNGKFTTPMRRIIKQMPSVAEEVFNRCATTNEDEETIDSPAFKIEFNYEFLEDFREPRSHHRIHTADDTASIATADIDDTKTVLLEPVDAEHTGYETSWGPVGYSSKYHTLRILAHSKSKDLLKHPLIASLLNYKWLSYGQWIYFGNVSIQFIFVLFLTAFALTVLSPTTQTCLSVFNGSNGTDCTAETSRASQIYIPIGATIVILFAAIKLIFEFFQFVKFRFKYFLDWVNYLEICLFSFSIFFAAVYFTDCFCPRNFQWQLGAIAVFLSWIDLVIIIRKFPVTGIYVVMFMNIFYIFLKLAFLAVLLILAFGLSFYMVFHNPMNMLLNIRTPFQDPGRSLIKTMTMTTGEFEFDSIFRQTGENANVSDIQFPVVSYILWILFLVLMPILLTNLLVGLAVDDIKGIQESAAINRLALRVELTLSVEEYIPAKLRRRLFIGRRVMHPNRQSGFAEYIRYNLFGLFRFDSVENIKSALNPQPEPIEEVQGQNRQLSEQVDELRRTVEYISEQNERLTQLITAIAENQGMALEPTMSVHSSSMDPERTARDRSVSVPLSEI